MWYWPHTFLVAHCVAAGGLLYSQPVMCGNLHVLLMVLSFFFFFLRCTTRTRTHYGDDEYDDDEIPTHCSHYLPIPPSTHSHC